MTQFQKRLAALVLAALMLAGTSLTAEAKSKKKKATPTPTVRVTATATPEETVAPALTPETTPEPEIAVEEDGTYTDKEHVAAYLRKFRRLPSNYITKRDAQDLGWSGNGRDSIWKYAPGKSIGGSRFGNYEEKLPDREGRRWYECDIDYDGVNRGVKRIIYSNDGLIYYTEDHYETFVEITEPETRAGP